MAAYQVGDYVTHTGEDVYRCLRFGTNASGLIVQVECVRAPQERWILVG